VQRTPCDREVGKQYFTLELSLLFHPLFSLLHRCTVLHCSYQLLYTGRPCPVIDHRQPHCMLPPSLLRAWTASLQPAKLPCAPLPRFSMPPHVHGRRRQMLLIAQTTPCWSGLSTTSQRYFSIKTSKPPAKRTWPSAGTKASSS
jgi:hypothetical protein